MCRMRRRLPILLCLVLVCSSLPLGAVRQPLCARPGMVGGMEAIAADVGVSVLQKGGNAVDAAVAVGFALAVTHPFAGNIGGGGFMLIRFADGRATVIDFPEKAPRQATHDMYLDASGNVMRDSLVGWRAVGVPGTVRGLELALRKYGTKSWSGLLEPAIHLASSGFPISYSQMRSFHDSADLLSRFPDSKRIFLKDGAFYDWNETLQQP